jgi:hypothetical protein
LALAAKTSVARRFIVTVEDAQPSAKVKDRGEIPVNATADVRLTDSETDGPSEVVRAEALFASTLQSSESPTADQVRRAVSSTLLRLGANGCVSLLADEFGEHPDTAAARMCWALRTTELAFTAS